MCLVIPSGGTHGSQQPTGSRSGIANETGGDQRCDHHETRRPFARHSYCRSAPLGCTSHQSKRLSLSMGRFTGPGQPVLHEGSTRSVLTSAPPAVARAFRRWTAGVPTGFLCPVSLEMTAGCWHPPVRPRHSRVRQSQTFWRLRSSGGDLRG
jgi:hypothetical protein